MTLSETRDMPSVDIETYQGLALMLNDEFYDIVSQFFNETPEKISTMCEALSNNNLELAKNISHQLKSASGNLALSALSNAFNVIEISIINGSHVDSIEARQVVTSEFERAQSMVKDLQWALLYNIHLVNRQP